MPFNKDGFAQAAKAMGYSDDEINAIATMKEAQAQSPANVLSDTYQRSKEEQAIRDLNFQKNASTTPLNLGYDPNISAAQQYQKSLNEDFSTTGGLRKTDIKDFYDPYLKEEAQVNVTRTKDKDLVTKQAAAIDSVLSTLDELRDLSQKYNIGDIAMSKVGLSSADNIFEQKKALVGQQIAKLAEYGKTQGGRGISDKDREFYQSKVVNISPIGLQTPIDERIESLKRDIMRTAGFDPSALDEKSSKPLPSVGTPQRIGKYSVTVE